jgi:hypothetical protein
MSSHGVHLMFHLVLYVHGATSCLQAESNLCQRNHYISYIGLAKPFSGNPADTSLPSGLPSSRADDACF